MEIAEKPVRDFRALREDLMSFLGWRRAAAVEDLVQEALLRILKKVKGGEDIKNLQAYSRRVADVVHLEDLRRRRRETVLLDHQDAAANPYQEQLLECLEICKKKCLTQRELRFIEQYYSSNAAQRKLLAKSHNWNDGQLRAHAMEIRIKLRCCVQNHVSQLEI